VIMGHFTSYDGTELGYRVRGDGPPLVCLPGGPGRSVDYLGDLGGLDRTRQLVQLDPRGVGLSHDPADPATLRVDRLVDDVEALRAYRGMDRMDLLAHSAGAILATLYAAAHPGRVSRLILVTPGLAAVGVSGTEEQFDATVRRRATEPWYATARAALEQIRAGDLSMDVFAASRPLCYGRWDDAAAARAMVGIDERHHAARQGYFADLTLDPAAIRTALRALTAPVLLYAGDRDPMVAPAVVKQAAPVFPDSTVTVQSEAGHFPWIDSPSAFADTVDSFLS
jgi:pimeloyl-ACP methyl ester carboxylesterase